MGREALTKLRTAPVYARLRKEISEAITSKKFLPGDIIPSEYELTQKYRISRRSVRKALSEFEEEGLILRIPGKGSFVKDRNLFNGKGNRNFIGINVPVEEMYIRGPYYMDLMKGVVNTCNGFGFRLELVTRGTDLLNPYRGSEDGFLLDGVVWMDPTDEDLVRLTRLTENLLPVVIVNRASQNLNYVTTDHRGGACQGVDYLARLGHEKIAIAGRPSNSSPEIKERFRGYADALAQNGLRLDEGLILEIRGSKEEECLEIKLLLERKSPTAIFVTTGSPVANILQTIYDSGLKVPDDISVVCFDDMEEFISHPGPPLTCIKQPLYKMGRRAVESVLEITKKGASFSVQETLATELVVRQSCSRVKR